MDAGNLRWNVGESLNGPLVGRPGFGYHVSNWLGPPHNHSRMQCFWAFLVSSAKRGLWNSPVKLVALASAPPVVTP